MISSLKLCFTKLYSVQPHRELVLGIKLIDLTLSRGYQPGIVIIDPGYGHNRSLLLKIENRN
jgi:hypothetical protein